MGSFAMTCAVSGLPIGGGEPIRFMLLTESNIGRTPCYIHDLWAPRTWPIKAEYNDYGGIEETTVSAVRETWMEAFAKDLVELPVGENSAHNVATSCSMSWDKMLEALWEERISVHSRRGDQRTLAIRQAMIREDVWQLLASMQITDEFYPYADTAAIIESTWERNTQPMPQHMLEILQEEMLAPPLIANDCPGTIGLRDSFRLVAERFKRGEMPEAEVAPFKLAVTEYYRVERVLAANRYWWRPSYPIGGQEPEWSTHVQYLSALARLASKKARERDMDDGPRNRGFADLSAEQRIAISSRGGKAAHVMGTAHQWDSGSAAVAGRKGSLMKQMRAIVRRAMVQSGTVPPSIEMETTVFEMWARAITIEAKAAGLISRRTADGCDLLSTSGSVALRVATSPTLEIEQLDALDDMVRALAAA